MFFVRLIYTNFHDYDLLFNIFFVGENRRFFNMIFCKKKRCFTTASFYAIHFNAFTL